MRPEYRVLPTARLLLRPPREEDAPAVFESFGSDPEVTRLLTWRPHRSLVDAQAALRTRLERLARGREYSWIIELREPGRLVGIVSAWIDGDGAELGFVLARPHWGRGIATEAVAAVADWALSLSDVTRVWGTCDTENGASARVFAKAGFACHGVCEREIVRPNLGPAPRPSLLFSRGGLPRRDSPTPPENG